MRYRYNKDISNLARGLDYLEIDIKKRRELIKEIYGCIPILFGFPQALKNSIEKAKKDNLKQNEAYEYLKESINKYDSQLASEMASQRDYTFNTSNQYGF